MSNSGLGRRTLLAGVLALLAGCAAQPRPTGSGPISASPTLMAGPPSPATSTAGGPTGEWRTTAMTYNILTGTRKASAFHRGVQGPDVAFTRRAPVLADWINAAAADIVGLQENEPMPAPTLRPIRRLAPMLPGYRVVQADTNVPILIRSGAYTIGESGAFVISTALRERGCTWVRLSRPGGSGALLVANTHLDTSHTTAQAKVRSASLDVLVDALSKLNPGWRTPMILLGDFNTRSDEARPVFRDALVKLPEAGLRNAAADSWLNASQVPRASSLNGFGTTVDGRWRYLAIRTDGVAYDYAWVSPQVDVRSWQVLTGPGIRDDGDHPYFAEPVPSDHCPVKVALTIPVA